MTQVEKKFDSYSQGWIGVIPKHWHIKRIKHIARFTTGWTPPTGNAASYIGANPWANIGDLGPKVITETANQISDEAVKNTGINISPIGSLLFSFKLSVGQVSIAGQSMFTNEAIATFPPQDNFDIQWAYYAFPQFIPENAAINIYGAKLLNQQRINDALLPFPPKNEQITIAAYLDTETKRIDGLIEEKKKLKDLLIELRKSTISEAVTKGLDSTAPIKDSGVAWLGKIPEHWAAVPVKYVCTYNDDVLPESIASDTLIKYVEISDVDQVNGLKSSESMAFQDAPSRARRLVRDGDIIISTVRTYLRAVAPIKSPPDNLVVSTGFAVIRPDGLAPSFARYALVADGFVGSVIARSTGVSYPAINASDLVRIPVPVPPIDEQITIAAYLDTETKRIDGLISHVDSEIELLKELRASTITDAVLGRIDVRKTDTH